MVNVGILPSPSQKETLHFSQESICSFTVKYLWIWTPPKFCYTGTKKCVWDRYDIQTAVEQNLLLYANIF